MPLARLFALAAAGLWLLGTPAPAGAQAVPDTAATDTTAAVRSAPAPDTTDLDIRRTVRVPVPERGALYYRRGAGGTARVRLGGRRPSPRAAYRAAAPLQALAGDTSGVRRQDLLALEQALMDRLDARLAALDRTMARQPPYVVRVRRGADGRPETVLVPLAGAAAAQRLRERSAAPAADPGTALPILGARRPALPGVRAVPPGTALPPALIERTLLETGLFRTLDVVFEFDESTLLPHSANTLDAVGAVLARNRGLVVEIAGHTDSIGPDAYNQRLSRRRAETVRQYLLDRFPIDPDRLAATGYGETQPIATNDNPTGRTLNRRVEFRVIE